jgi:hypothetical protein
MKTKIEKILSFPSLNPLDLTQTAFNFIEKLLQKDLNIEEFEVKRLRRMKVKNVQIVINKPDFVSFKLQFFSAGLSFSGMTTFEGEFSVFLQNLDIETELLGNVTEIGNYEYLKFHTAKISRTLKDYQLNSFKDKCNCKNAAFFEGLRNFETFSMEKCYSFSKLFNETSIRFNVL